MHDVLFVSKAIAPPWNDSGKNLVFELARGLTRYHPTLMTGQTSIAAPAGARLVRVYDGGTGFAPALADQARVFRTLLTARGHRLWHFFFAPNPRSCRAGALAKRLRRRPAVHTLSSAPRDPRAVVPLLFAEQNVVLSHHTERRMREAGLAASRMVRIAPAITPLALRDEDARQATRRALSLPCDRPIVVYPGDLEFGGGAERMLEAARALRQEVELVLACRAKTARAREREAVLRERARSLGLGPRVHFVGETRHIHDLLACADVIALPSEDLYAKMDYPLVLLEAMSLARAVIVARGSAAEELAEEGGALALSTEPEALADGIARLLDDDGARARIGDEARRVVALRHAPEVMAAAYEHLYDTLLA